MKTRMKILCTLLAGLVFPMIGQSQGIASEMNSLHAVLDQLYEDMMPLCSRLIGVGQGIAGFAATWYIASRVWRHIANAEPIDFYPLFRPFVIGFCVSIFPMILALINGVMKPTVTVTANMVKDSDKAIAVLLQKKEEAIKQTNVWQMYVGESGSGDRDKWYKYTHDNANPSSEGMFEGIGNDIKFAMAKAAYNFRNSIKEWMSEVLKVLFEAAALCINTLRTFQLIVLAILGPLVFGIAVFDGFQHTLTAWIARYINIFLWLPVANIFGSMIGKIEEKMLQVDISQVQDSGNTFFSSTDMAYLVFMIIGIVGYFTVPSVANYIVHAGGGGALGQKVTSMFHNSSRSIVNSASGGVSSLSSAMGNADSRMNGGGERIVTTESSASNGGGKSNYMEDKLSGK